MALGETCNREGVVSEKVLSVVGAAQPMRRRHVGAFVVRRRPVVDRDGGPAVILTRDDLPALLAQEMTERAELVSHERHREAVVRR